MASTLLQPPTSSSPQTALHLTQQAPSYLASQSSWLANLPYPLSLLSTNESQEKWQIYENIFLAGLRAGDTETAYVCLSAMLQRFGESNERVLALRGLYQEVTSAPADTAAQQTAMRDYEEILKGDPTLFAVRKRRAALLRSQGKVADTITALTNLLDASPTDAETWSELADVYLKQGAYEQAIFCLEEVLLLMPNAWNMHARLGEVLFLFAGRLEKGSGELLKTLSESMRRFCRSIELCDDYLRGFYGLKLTTTRLIEVLPEDSRKAVATSGGDLPLPKIGTVKQLNELATSKLAEILRQSSSGTWDGYSPAELIAARELLERDTPTIQR